jgi:hypothetical protein
MIKWIRKNEKKVMAVFAVGLMVMFIKGLVPDTGQSHATDRVIGTIGGSKISQSVLANYNAEWQTLKRLYLVDPNHPDAEPQSLVAVHLGSELAARINQSSNSSQGTPLYYLLIQEAIRQGVVIPKEDLETFLRSYVLSLPEPGTDARENVEDAVAHCLMIERMLDRASSVIKISRPLQELNLAQTLQELSVKFVPVLASSFLSQVPAPTPADIQKQFDQYSDRIAAARGQQTSQFGEKSDPLGFGYKIPNRVQIQYIGLNHSDLHDAGIASKSKEDWYVAAYGEFKNNREDYDSRPLTPATQPVERLGPGNQPTTRKIENLDDDFALHADLVLTDLYNRETDKLAGTILKQINEKMSYGFGSYRDALASAGGAAAANDAKLPAGAGADYISYKFMQDLAASIRSQYGITPIVGNIEQLKTEEQLSQIPGIGHSVIPISGSNREIPFPAYAVDLFQPFMNDATKNSSLEALAVAQWQPSNPMEDETQNVYVFRISGNDRAHTPPLADVKDQVISDWKINAAYEKALEASRQLLASAQKQGLDAAAAEGHYSSPIVTDPFDPKAIQAGEAAPSIPPLQLTPDSARELADASLNLLTTSRGQNNRPQLLAELYADRIASVIELHEAKPLWNPQTKSFYIIQMMMRMREQLQPPLNAQLSTFQVVSDRLNYQPEKNSKTAESP